MTPDELFALPVGTRIEYWTSNMLGTLTGWSAGRLVVRWDDGAVRGVSRDDEHLADFARQLLPVVEPSAVG